MSVGMITFKGHESTGSVAKRNDTRIEIPQEQGEGKDTVSFRGQEYGDKKKSGSVLGTILTIAGLSALVIGGLGYAHKADLVGKLKDGKFKDFLKKSDCVTEKCHEWCSKVKQFFIKKK